MVDMMSKQQARRVKRTTLDQAEAARRAVKLQCGGRDYSSCQDVAAKAIFDKTLYEASGSYVGALTALQQADTELKHSQANLDNARDEQLTLPRARAAQRAKLHEIREELDKEAAAPSVNAQERTSSLARAMVELDDWKKLLTRVESALAFAAQAAAKAQRRPCGRPSPVLYGCSALYSRHSSQHRSPSPTTARCKSA